MNRKRTFSQDSSFKFYKTPPLSSGAFLPHPPSFLNTAVCEACTATVDEIESVLAMDELEKLLEDITALACSLLPGKPASDTVS